MHFKNRKLLMIVVVAFQFSLQNEMHIGKWIKVYKGQERHEVGLSVMMTNISRKVYCAGSLINPKFILTSARCLRFMTSMNIFVGTKKLYHHDVCAPSAKFKQAIIHEKFNFNHRLNDIGLVELLEPLQLSWQIAVVELSTVSDSRLLVGKIGRVTGFAKAVNVHNRDNTDLTELKVHLLSIDKSDTKKELNSNQLNGYSERHGKPYSGAMGAPLMLKDTNIQIGVASFSDRNYKGVIDVNWTQVYTNVGSYLDWIKKNSRLN